MVVVTTKYHQNHHLTSSKTSSNVIQNVIRHPKRHPSSKTSSVIQNIIRHPNAVHRNLTSSKPPSIKSIQSLYMVNCIQSIVCSHLYIVNDYVFIRIQSTVYVVYAVICTQITILKDGTKIEQVQTQFLNRELECDIQTSNIMSRGEVGARPLLVEIIRRMILYHNKILVGNSSITIAAIMFEKKSNLMPNFVRYTDKFNLNLEHLLQLRLKLLVIKYMMFSGHRK